jgi:hypothetical protein
VRDFLVTTYSKDDLKVFIARSEQTAKKHGWKSELTCISPPTTPQAFAQSQFQAPPTEYSIEERLGLQLLCSDSQEANALLGGLQMVQLNMKSGLSAKSPRDDNISGFGVLKTVFWPFVLASSLALRLTKATADVTGWAKVK